MKPVHYAHYENFHPAVGAPFETRRIVCGAPEKSYADKGGTNYTAVKEQVTCKRCVRSPLYDPILYRGRY